MAAPPGLSLNGGQVLIQLSENNTSIEPSQSQKMSIGDIVQLSYSDHKYSIGQSVWFSNQFGVNFRDANENKTYSIIEEKFIYFSNQPPL